MDDDDRMLYDIITAWPHLSPWKKLQIFTVLFVEVNKQRIRNAIQWALSFPEWLLNKFGIR